MNHCPSCSLLLLFQLFCLPCSLSLVDVDQNHYQEELMHTAGSGSSIVDCSILFIFITCSVIYGTVVLCWRMDSGSKTWQLAAITACCDESDDFCFFVVPSVLDCRTVDDTSTSHAEKLWFFLSLLSHINPTVPDDVSDRRTKLYQKLTRWTLLARVLFFILKHRDKLLYCFLEHVQVTVLCMGCATAGSVPS